MDVAGRAPAIRYAKSGDLNIAFSVTGEGPDLVVAPGFISHLDIMWEEPSVVHFYSRLASFRRVVTFDKRGTGLSDPAMHAPTLEESVDDLRAVMDAAGCERADVLGISEGGTMAILMTASHPDRVKALASCTCSLRPQHWRYSEVSFNRAFHSPDQLHFHFAP